MLIQKLFLNINAKEDRGPQREECEEKLKVLIAEMKKEIAETKTAERRLNACHIQENAL